jgi:DNA-binding CsgD family transcriptional regulator
MAARPCRDIPDAGTLHPRLRGVEPRIKRGQDSGRTAAELRVLGFSRPIALQETADRLDLSRATVKTHVASIYDRHRVSGRSEAVEIIEQLGLGSAALPDPDRDQAASRAGAGSAGMTDISRFG